MASSAFPALAIQSQGESPINLLGKIEQIKSAQQSQEMGSIQLQQARLAQQSQQALMEAFSKNNGDLNQTLADFRASGKALPNDVLNLQEKSVAIQTNAAKLTSDQLDNLVKEKAQVANTLEQFKSLPIDQRTPQNLAGMFKTLNDQGVNPQKYMSNFQSLATNPSDDNIRHQEIGLQGEQWVLNNEKSLREAASAPTPSQAQQKTQLELDKLKSDALSAQRLFENMPSPLEAHTEREAKLREENSQTAKNYVDIAKTKYDMMVKQNEPVIGKNQAGLMEVTTRVDADAKKLTMVNPLTADQYDKQSMLSARFGQVANNLGKYEAAIRQAGPIVHQDDIAQVIADQALGKDPGHILGLTPSASLVASKEVSKVTADAWNKLTPDERKMTQAYLQVKGGIITYNKAVDDTGRANETALSLEAANIPSPLEEKNVALGRIQGNKDNLKTILPAIPHFSNVPDPMKYLEAGENTPITSGTKSVSPIPSPGAGVSIGPGIGGLGAILSYKEREAAENK